MCINTFKNKLGRALAGFLCIVLLAGGMIQTVYADEAYSSYISLPPVKLDLKGSYFSYIQKYQSEKHPEQPIVIKASGYSGSDYRPQKTADTLQTSESGYVEWEFDVKSSGLYYIKLDYLATSGKSSSVVRSIKLDGELPFEEARSVEFNRVWIDKKDAQGNTIREASNGNQIRPEQIEFMQWQSAYIKDSVGYYTDPFQFYFSEGRHTVRLDAVREPMEIKTITLCQMKQPLSYEQAKPQLKKYSAPNVESVKLQGEKADYKSDPMLVPIYDRSNASMEPSDPMKLKLNCIGSTQWQMNGQTISWKFKVTQDGLYNIHFRGIQNAKNGSVSSRRIYINGEVPYSELNDYSIPYSTQWKIYTLGDDKESYSFYFEKDKDYEIKFEVTLGKSASIIREVNDIVNELNNIYREILVVTGPSPDQYRDYQFKENLPDTMKNLKAQTERLNQVMDQLINRSGMQGENIQIIKRLAIQTQEMCDKPENIAKRFNAFQQNISSLGTWVSTESQQPLTIDYLLISPADSELPKASLGFFAEAGYHIRSFISSFLNDYNNLSYGSDGRKSVTVWVGNGVTGGRDQAQVLKNMADNYFTARTNINANIQLISMGALLPATLAGKGPDVALTLTASDVCNYAFRNAVLDLAQFPDYKEVAERFYSSAIVPLSFENGVYGLPETQTFPMLFYRKDILSELGLAIPQTWDDVLVMLPMLQKNKMSFGLPSAISYPIGMNYRNFLLFLFQAGGNVYSEKGKTALLDSAVAVETFTFMTSLYTDYGLSKEYSFLNQFRSGSVPIGISDYSLFNQLSVFAPELNGVWEFTSVPGTLNSEGKIDRTVPGEVNACMILSKTKHPQEAWEFIKWWTDAEAQSKFGKELESIMGTAARYSTANKEAMYDIPWAKTDFDKIKEQMQWVKGVPEVPGGYYTQRYMDFAFKDVVNAKEKPAKVLAGATITINNEIAMKRKEFGLKD